jgi:hypothetical protein
MGREVLNELDLTKTITHPGESGRAREQILAGFIRRLLPASFAVSTGFVLDTAGRISRQIDLVIYRRDYHPVIQIGGVNHFLIESVAAVIEMKADIQSVDRLMQALENIRSVKSLDRTNRGSNYLLGHDLGTPVDPDNFQHQVFGAVVTEQSLTPETLRGTLLSFLEHHPRREWPNLYIDVNRFTANYQAPRGGFGAVTEDAIGLAITEARTWSPLLELAFELVNFLRITPVVDYWPTAYFGTGTQGGDVSLF